MDKPLLSYITSELSRSEEDVDTITINTLKVTQ